MGFDDFDYAKVAKGGVKAVTGIVKAVYPMSGPGVDQAKGGLEEALRAAGVSMGEDSKPSTPAAQLDRLDLPKTPQEVSRHRHRQNRTAADRSPDGRSAVSVARLDGAGGCANHGQPQSGPAQPGRRLPLDSGARVGTDGARGP